MKKLFGLLVLLLMLVGCSSQQTTTVKAGGTEVEVTTNVQNAEDWCQTGSKWSMDGTQGSMNMIIEGIISSGKYAGYCHVTYDVGTEEGQVNADFYFNEEGAGYQVIEVNGQTIESSWTAPEQ